MQLFFFFLRLIFAVKYQVSRTLSNTIHTTESCRTCYRKLKHLPGDLWKHVLQLLDEAEFFRSCAEHLADLVHQLHCPGHVIAVLLTHLRIKCKTENWTNIPLGVTNIVRALFTEKPLTDNICKVIIVSSRCVSSKVFVWWPL